MRSHPQRITGDEGARLLELQRLLQRQFDMRLVPGIAILLVLAACTSAESVISDGESSTVPTHLVVVPTNIAPSTTVTSAPFTTTTESSATTSQAPEKVAFEWPLGTVTCAEIEGNFPLGVDDHGIYLDEGLVSYYRPSGADLVEEVFIQFVDDPTCTADSEAWMGMISYLVNPESLHGAGLCDFYLSLIADDPPPANIDTVLTQLAAAEQLCK